MQRQIPKQWNKALIISQCDLGIAERPRLSREWEREPALPGLADILSVARHAKWRTDKTLSENAEYNNVLAKLENIAQGGDEVAFLKTLSDLSWECCSAADIVKVIRLALRAGAHGAIHQIALKGIEHHPNNPDVQKYMRLYGPVQRTRTQTGVRRLNHMANKAWLTAHMGEYRDQWIAVRDGVLLGSAPTLEELHAAVGDTTRALVTIGF